MNDAFRGDLNDSSTTFLEMPFKKWLQQRGLSLTESDIEQTGDIQSASIFPVVASIDDLGTVLRWMISEPSLLAGKQIWMSSLRLSADEISEQDNLTRLYKQREEFCKTNW